MGKDFKKYNGKKCGKNNTIPKNICSVIEKIEELNFVKHVSPGAFRTSRNPPKIDIIGYDDRHKKYSVNIYGGKYVQKILLDVSKHHEDYEKEILACLSL